MPACLPQYGERPGAGHQVKCHRCPESSEPKALDARFRGHDAKNKKMAQFFNLIQSLMNSVK